MLYADYVDYFRTLAKEHVDILHDPAAGRNRFMRMNVEDAFQHITGLTSPFIALESFEYFRKSPSADQHLRTLKGGFMILKTVPEGYDNRTQEDAALQFCMDIQTDIENRLLHDKKSGRCHWLRFLDDNSIRCYKVGPLFNNAFGWLCEFNVDTRLNLTYDPAKWQSI